MGKPTGFKEFLRQMPSKRSPQKRVDDYNEFYNHFPDDNLKEQAARCMDCGVPFCHLGCPLGNIIPDWNDLVYQGDWREAYARLQATNNFPEFTGRLCPAPCEEACVLGITDPPVTIELIEKTIVERAFSENWIWPERPSIRTGKTIAVIGSGPAGLACAQQLNRAGHTVTVLERADRIGGLLRYGIPEFKMEKRILDRRLSILEEEGIIFKTHADVGNSYPVEKLKQFDAVVLCGGATKPRDLPVPGRNLADVHFAMDYLTQQNQRCEGDDLAAMDVSQILTEGKHVLVIGGGDTGSDCIGTANRQKAASVTNFELLDKPTENRPEHQPWPYWPMRLRTSSSHEEGCERQGNILTKEFTGENGRVTGLKTVNVEFVQTGNSTRPQMLEVPGSEKKWKADLVLLALGFTGPEPDGMLSQLGIALDERGNVKTDEYYQSNVSGIFAAGDVRRGQSLIVWAISEGREAARNVDKYLMGHSDLPTKGASMELPRV